MNGPQFKIERMSRILGSWHEVYPSIRAAKARRLCQGKTHDEGFTRFAGTIPLGCFRIRIEMEALISCLLEIINGQTKLPYRDIKYGSSAISICLQASKSSA
jgi:hypothetical protein